MSKFTFVERFPKCELCGKEAHYDAKILWGPWAFLCVSCFNGYGIGLGVGKGQELKISAE
jgi:hypothetical protein